MYSEILFELVGPIARITLNRPERRNPIGPTTLGELAHALGRSKSEAAARVVVLTGAGKAFSAGGDLASFAGRSNDAPPAIAPASFVDIFLALQRLGKPSIAMVNGHALAGGLGLVVACDLAIASEEAQFATPEINVGLWPMMISALIVRNVGRKRALELMLTGDRISAAEAAASGLITRAVPKAELETAVTTLAEKLAQKSPQIMALGLRAFYQTQDLELEPALRHLEGELATILATDDAREGLMAFLEKRPPHWPSVKKAT